MSTGHYVHMSINDYTMADFQLRSEKVHYPPSTIPTLHSLVLHSPKLHRYPFFLRLNHQPNFSPFPLSVNAAWHEMGKS
jgi:hypothetical protein